MDGTRVAIVTGGSSGIGLACGRLLAAAGYDVVLTARREVPLADAAKAIGARSVAADSADPEAFARVVAEAGRVDLLVHAAGVMDGTFVRKESIEAFEAVLRTNLTSAFVVSAAALPAMAAGSRIVFLSSSSAHAPQPGRAAYSASKAGLNAFAGALAKEVDRDGIAVHVVTTGPVATPMLDDVHFPMLNVGCRRRGRDGRVAGSAPAQRRPPRGGAQRGGEGPFAPEPFVPEAARKLGRTEIPGG